MIYLISKAWSDDMENTAANAFGYSTMGYVETEEEAKKFEGFLVPASFSWTLDKPAPMYLIEKLPKLSIKDNRGPLNCFMREQKDRSN